MSDKRKAYAPFSLITESGVSNAPVEGYIDVNQEIQPIVSTGVVNEDGVWTGVKSSDKEFIGTTRHVAVANGGETLSPDTGNMNHLDMTGFCNLVIAIKPSNGGTYGITAVMGPDTERFANLSPVNSGVNLRYARNSISTFEPLFDDSNETLTADVWNIFMIQCRTEGQKNLQFKVTNSSGGESTFEVAFLRMVG